MNLKSLSGRSPKPPKVRFEHSYMPEPNSGCWLWLGRERGSNGYGSIKVNGKHVQAHRYSYELKFGEIPKGMIVCHTCDVPACVNPSHLFIGTTQDNSDDKVAKQRQARGKSLSISQGNHVRRGERNPNNKLRHEQVKAILSLNLPQRQIAKLFGVTQALISKIKRKEIWNG